MILRTALYCTLTWLSSVSCAGQQRPNKDSSEPNQNEPTAVRVTSLKEASGIADSKTHPEALWVVEDSGNPAKLVLLGYDGQLRKKVVVKGATNRDWEELALAAGHLYIGDIGDNSRKHDEYRIYRLKEPLASTDTAALVQTIRFRYAGGSHDAEAFLVDPGSGDIFIITKRETQSLVYRLSYPYSFSKINTATQVGTLSFNGAVGAALSPDGSEIMVKTYEKIYRFSRKGKEALSEALKRTPTLAPYKGEPQGESICYKLDGSGYFTISEQVLKLPVYLYFYKR